MTKFPTPMLMTGFMLASDALAIFCSGAVSVSVRYAFEGQFHPSLYWDIWPVGLFFLMAYAAAGLYPGVLVSPPEELKRASLATSFCFVGLAAVTFISREAELYSRGIFLMSWVLILVALPVFRAILKSIVQRAQWWGYPAVIIGDGEAVVAVAKILLANPRMGVRPRAVLGGDKYLAQEAGLPHGEKSEARIFAAKWKHSMAFVVPSEGDVCHWRDAYESHVRNFYRVILIPGMFGLSSLWVAAVDFGGILGLELKQKLLDPKRQVLKRGFDLVLIICLGVPIIPLALGLALAIVLDSPGPVFYSHLRIGRGGRPIRVWKFRTMAKDADKILDKYLQDNPALLCEWEREHKIRKDPRVTRVGRFLRMTSLDELPQFWNVLKGDMSLVGPRPIVEGEIHRYREIFELYKRVRPGITGLWQISGRSTVGYGERINLDAYYVRNWSLWLDIYIMAKTPMEVCRCRGAV
ncbi:MAG: undecaprenyl-phosphate galactose phosphotransferase WbaP [Deltaproteobacteria bacterium]|nr:undecaprenyl-phosphate galactose phosphotransferase WbaP [Deltaproteobacteria bacterium]